MNNKCDLSIVVPAFNEAESLSELNIKLFEAFPPNSELSVEIIFVNDGSTDKTKQILKYLISTDSRIKAISFKKNLGKTIALAQGFKLATGNIIATLDADLQNEPDDILDMIKLLDDRNDLVCGWRKERRDPINKTFPSKIINSIISLTTKLKIHDINCGLKVFKREIIEQIHLSGKQHRYIPLKAHFDGFSVTEKVIKHNSRKYGYSKYGFLRFPEGIFDLITILFIGKFDRSPLYLFGGLGFIIFGTGAAILTYLMLGWFMGNWIANRPIFSIGILLIIFGFQLLSMGLLAELLLNLCGRSKDPPSEEIK